MSGKLTVPILKERISNIQSKLQNEKNVTLRKKLTSRLWLNTKRLKERNIPKETNTTLKETNTLNKRNSSIKNKNLNEPNTNNVKEITAMLKTCVVEDERTKEKAAENETKDIESIVKGIKEKNESGIKIINAFKEKFDLEILDARARKGSRKTHYDFEILLSIDEKEVWKHVEHKGSKDYKPINTEKKVWASGVQFYNGPADKFSFTKKYAQLWYDTYIESNLLKNEWALEAAVPSFNDWYTKDAKVQGDPKTPFGKELKKKVREKLGARASLLDKRTLINETLEMTEEDETLFIQEVLPITNTVLNDKDYWLVIHGNVNSNFHVAWFPKFLIPTINSVKINKCKDLQFEFLCDDNYTFNGILRWGKGAGFSNLRVDLK